MRIWRVPYPKFGQGPGLGRVAAVAEKLGIALPRFGESGAVLIGSNGKGSTAAMTAAMLMQTGQPVGLFTSPHLLSINERFRIGDDDISDEELELSWDRVAAAAHVVGVANTMGGFEFLFLIAADWFTARGCVHTVWEAGIGGRLDPVRLIEARQLALTSLDFEHTALLGDTLAQIAREKIDAAPSGAKLYVSESCAALHTEIETYASSKSVRTEFVAAADEAPLLGAHQRRNAALAQRLARDIAGLCETDILHGLARTRWQGRLETINAAPPVVIDVGHTPEAIAAAAAAFETMHGSGVLVCGVSQDKSVDALIAPLAPRFSTIICAAARHKGAPAAHVAQSAAAANDGAEIIIADSVAEAHRLALAREAPIYVAGGLFLAAEFKAVHLGRDPALLAFF